MPLVHKFSDYRNTTKPEVILLLKSFVRCSIARCSKTPLGFTLLELLVVIAILSLLAAIAIPSFLRQTNRAREAEAKTYVGAINRAQQSYFTENWKFGSLADLEMGISNSNNYSYDSNPSISATGSSALTTATPISGARGYAGKVWLAPGISGDVTSYTLLCEGLDNSTPTISGTTCPN
ncbi:MAG: prepilin-type N-terminal cleavage/methylation domain-containing protein [Leptolyngbyaceae cyanobacterium CRU_2_3]|nr:prepilin-type N-terminal cleavage/methylation domain-containing protein [Leptolyngbyaceae cyanobacterium CRU_2_3]